jgi:hypothetical protein
MGTWQQSGQNAGVRAIRDGAWGECLRETNTLLCEQVQGGRLDTVVTITVHMVGAESINSDEEDVGAGNALLAKLGGGASARSK